MYENNVAVVLVVPFRCIYWTGVSREIVHYYAILTLKIWPMGPASNQYFSRKEIH